MMNYIVHCIQVTTYSKFRTIQYKMFLMRCNSFFLKKYFKVDLASVSTGGGWKVSEDGRADIILNL